MSNERQRPQGQRSANLVEARPTGIAQRIMAARATNCPEEPGPERDIDRGAALAAIDLAAMGVGRIFESGMPIDVELASHLMALLMMPASTSSHCRAESTQTEPKGSGPTRRRWSAAWVGSGYSTGRCRDESG